ncbi:LysR family transcriptional regulator [Histidinibacterium aquaticum]|uniref:LysR family transcriptional regulator n=1 Tax=Histidinibacterium aquaticum TaxID=2613962 RepID=A0A5J5GMS0_9RHOB|nr:LysR family transcriptional regulator [Histidinibacterium aquaticum]KAA9008782.1 LysR family transcriptional regulator [Histidinibacterium aquaticum]
MRITLGQLEAFVAVVEAGTFEEAARRLNLTQSTVSKRISDLEAGSRIDLFDRSKRRASLTEAGEKYFERAKDLMSRAADLETDSYAMGSKRSVRMGVTELSSLTWLPTFLEQSVSQSPDLEYEITIGLSRDLMQMVEDDELDIVVIPEMHFPRTVNFRKISDLEVALFSKPGRITDPLPIPIANLKDYDIIMQGSRSGFSARLSSWLQKHNVTRRPTVKIDSQHATLGLVVAGKGLCIAAKSYMSTLTESGRVEIIPTKPELPPVAYYAVYRQSARDAFFDALCEQIAEQVDFATSFF